MQSKFITCACVAVFFCAGLAGAVHASAQSGAGWVGHSTLVQMAQTPSTGTVTSPNTHTQICQANLDQCLKGCDGATSCSNQCQDNYNRCVGQNP